MSFNIDHQIHHPDWLLKVGTAHFDQYALAVYRFQLEHSSIYREYVQAIGRLEQEVTTITEIPFLPISFFKTHKVCYGSELPALFFESSGTTGMQQSRHYIKEPGIYTDSFLRGFRHFYGEPEEFVFLCLLPSYIERGNSSLVYMADDLIKRSKHQESGFYLNEWEKLANVLLRLQPKKQKVILLGVTFALLDFAEQYPIDLSDVIVMETGGMKGRREEWTREQVHSYLKQQWHLESVHSEYGMTELLSQAYAKHDGIFKCVPHMKVLVRDENDPFDVKITGSGCLNVVDLANVYSCSFIATDDITKIHPNTTFEVLGRLDNSALRGCSLMVV